MIVPELPKGSGVVTWARGNRWLALPKNDQADFAAAFETRVERV